MTKLPSIAHLQELSTKAEAKLATERRQKEYDEAERIKSLAVILTSDIIDELGPRMIEAAGLGATEAIMTFKADPISEAALPMIRKAFQGRYQIQITAETVDHGDSAAPAKERIYRLWVSWEWRKP